MRFHGDNRLSIGQDFDGICEQQVLVTVDGVFEQPMRSDDFLTRDFSESCNVLDEERAMMGNGLDLELGHLIATVTQASGTEGNLMNSISKNTEYCLKSFHQLLCKLRLIFRNGGQ